MMFTLVVRGVLLVVAVTYFVTEYYYPSIVNRQTRSAFQHRLAMQVIKPLNV